MFYYFREPSLFMLHGGGWNLCVRDTATLFYFLFLSRFWIQTSVCCLVDEKVRKWVPMAIQSQRSRSMISDSHTLESTAILRWVPLLSSKISLSPLIPASGAFSSDLMAQVRSPNPFFIHINEVISFGILCCERQRNLNLDLFI